MANLGNRIVVLIDMDCFFCQVETKLNPEWTGKPLAVVQYNIWNPGGIIAVNYEARDFGVTRHMRGDEAKEKCPDLVLATVPCQRGKADTSRYRSAGREVIEVLKKNCDIVERASVDEAYLDITRIVDEKLLKENPDMEGISKNLNNTFIVGFSQSSVNDEQQRCEGLSIWLSEYDEDIQIQRLSIAGVIVENMRKEIFETTGFRCSAGISFNKILAKLACGLHKPNRQTILPASAVPDLFATLPVKKVRNLGGKLGDMVSESLKCNVMADLLQYSLQYLQKRFDEKTGLWLYNIARGVDSEPVTPRLVAKSIGACKRFPGRNAIVNLETLKHWLGDLALEVCERLEQDLELNERKASLLTVSFHFCQNKSVISQSRSCAITSYKPEKIAEQSLNIVLKGTQLSPISFLGISASKFIKAKGSENFINFFKTSAVDQPSVSVDNRINNETQITNEVKVERSETDEDDIEVLEENPNQLLREDEDVESSQTSVNTKVKHSVENTRIKEEKYASENYSGEIIGVKSGPEKNTLNDNSRPSTSKTKKSLKSSPCSSIQSSLKTDNFKKSFFMNILKDRQTKNEDLDDIDKGSSSPDVKNVSLDLFEDSPPNSTEHTVENKIANASTHSRETENESPSCSSTNVASVRLQEIFPDLNDIDPDVVRLLPSELQQEAQKFLKAVDTNDQNTEANRLKIKETRSTRGRPPKSKSSAQNANIQNFFIKTGAHSDLDNNFRKCVQCDQLILISKFAEHNDYHVAQNMQKEMNQIPMSNDENRKRKVLLNSPSPNKPNYQVKKRLSDELVDLPKTKSISSFFH